jgi:SAM-dependent methyltransferase
MGHGTRSRKNGDYNRVVADVRWRLHDLGAERVLTVDGREYRTPYSARVVRLLVERKGPRRAPLYFPFKQTRGRYFLEPLFAYLAARDARGLRVLEVGCSFGHITEYVDEQAAVAWIETFDVDPAFVAITRAKAEELPLTRLRTVRHLSPEETTRLPFASASFDLVLVVGVVEHLPAVDRHRHVDEYYRVLARGGHIAILDTPNRAFPMETHTVGLPGVQWLAPRAAYRYARALRPGRFAATSFEEFERAAWRNASWRECLPSDGLRDLVDVSEEAGYGWSFFRDTARSAARRALLPAFAPLCAGLRVLGRPPSLVLPYFNLVFSRR